MGLYSTSNRTAGGSWRVVLVHPFLKFHRPRHASRSDRRSWPPNPLSQLPSQFLLYRKEICVERDWISCAKKMQSRLPLQIQRNQVRNEGPSIWIFDLHQGGMRLPLFLVPFHYPPLFAGEEKWASQDGALNCLHSPPNDVLGGVVHALKIELLLNWPRNNFLLPRLPEERLQFHSN